MKKILLKTLGIFGLLFLTIALVYATVTTASNRKSSKLPWQGTPNGYYDSAHNVGSSYQAQARFSNAGTNDVAVYDSVTGLYWQKDGDAAGTHQWAIDNSYTEPTWNTTTETYTYPSGRTANDYPAFKYCEELSLGGYSNWRLPTYKELDSIVDYTTYNPSINTAYFTDTNTSNRYWSSTTTANGTSYAWIVNFNYGYSGRDGKTYSNYVRCVR